MMEKKEKERIKEKYRLLESFSVETKPQTTTGKEIEARVEQSNEHTHKKGIPNDGWMDGGGRVSGKHKKNRTKMLQTTDKISDTKSKLIKFCCECIGQHNTNIQNTKKSKIKETNTNRTKHMHAHTERAQTYLGNLTFGYCRSFTLFLCCVCTPTTFLFFLVPFILFFSFDCSNKSFWLIFRFCVADSLLFFSSSLFVCVLISWRPEKILPFFGAVRLQH